MTAHPTQAVRATIIRNCRRISELALRLDRPDLTPFEVTEARTDIKRSLKVLVRTDQVRRVKPDPVDEAQSIANVLQEVVWDALPTYLRAVDASLNRHGIPSLPVCARPFVFSSWAGGDRDGNPFVNAETTRRVVLMNRARACSAFLEHVENLLFDLPIQHTTTSLTAYIEALPSLPCRMVSTRQPLHKYFVSAPPSKEPYRTLLLHIRARLTATRDVWESYMQDERPHADNEKFMYRWTLTEALVKKRAAALHRTNRPERRIHFGVNQVLAAC
eukprot:GHVT01068775.1.p1 GENE.GHVT01068775.1~~GHVT01068775.1.p1  ORF type:complete len:274 (-),score=61.55 GHVT01068775.1:2825-3646(-)